MRCLPTRSRPPLHAELVSTLAATLDCECVLIGLVEPDGRRVRTLAGEFAGAPVELDYPLTGTPCADVLTGTLLAIAAGVQARYPDDPDLARLGLQSYVGARFEDPLTGRLGLVVAGSTRRLERPDRAAQATRAAAAAIEAARRAEAGRLADRIVHQALEAVDEGLLVVGTDGHLQHVNPAATRLLRLDPGAPTLTGRLSDVGREALAPLLRALDAGAPWHERLPYRSTPLQLAPSVLDLQVVPFEDGEGACAVVVRDVTGLVEQGQRLELALESAGAVPWDWAIEEGVFRSTGGFFELLGLPPGANEAIPVTEWSERIHPDDRERAESALMRMNPGTDDALRESYRLRHARGHYIWVQSFGRITEWSPAGAPRRAIGCTLDVDAEQRARAEAQELELRLRRFVENTPAAVAMVDRDLTYLAVSEGWCRLHSTAEVAILGRRHDQVARGFDARWRERFDRCLAGEPSASDRERLVLPGDAAIWVRWRLQPWHDEQGRVGGAVLVFEDITPLVENETRLAEARDQALAANEAKSAFLANMSHEIRTPLTAVLGFADLLLDEHADPDQVSEFAGTIQRNAAHLLALVDDILDLSKIEVGRMSVELRPMEPAPLLAGVAELFRARASARGLALGLELDPGLPETVVTDPTRLRQIVSNLVGNACKFTESGSVVLSARTDGERLRIAVRDTGVGMTAAQCARVFERFAQADETTTRRFGGTGLGLAISSQLAELLGGELTVESTPGRGSTFELCLPVGEVTPAAGTGSEGAVPALEEPRPALPDRSTARDQEAPPGRARPLAGRRILLAEDGPDNQRLIGLVLRRAGAELSIVGDGAAAVDAILGVRDTERAFELVLMDVQMPVLDGYAATRELRLAGIGTPIAALTAHSLTSERERARAAGCDAFLSKPLDRTRLVETARALLEGRPSDASLTETV